ncbi:hypothetical protein IP88_07480 [alpha proteobacterium AAP81b]|nr:hypothetical protein IP88_07480 [alpha proteobacterium AAP81b]
MRAAILLLTLPFLAGFADRDLSAVTDRNIAAMAVDMNPRYAGVPMEGSSGLAAARAVNRYRRGAVKPLTILRSSGISAQATTDSNPGENGAPVAPQ